MDEKELQEFDLEDILKEFGEPAEETEEQIPEESPEETNEKPLVSSDTAVFSVPEKYRETAEEAMEKTIRLDMGDFPKGQVSEEIAKAQIDEPEETQPEQEEAFSDKWEPEYEQPMGEYIPPQPIIFHPRSRLRELKRKLVAGPERQYYELSEKGLGKLQVAIFLSLLVVLICGVSTAIYAMGMVQANRMRLMVFSQFFAMLVSALLGSYQLLEGISDVFHKRFTLNTLLVFTFMICCLDGIVCLKELRIPCCAAFSLQVTMSLWSAYQKRNTQLGQLDTMRKATRLDGIGAVPNYYGKYTGFLKTEGQVEDFMDHYQTPSKPEKRMNIYAFVVLLLSIGIGITGGVLHGFSVGIQVAAATLLAAIPATAFICVSRPMAVLERKLHKLGTVLCGWQGVEGLSQKGVFPLNHDDLFPAGTIRMNGVKFFGDRDPDTVVAYAAALITADGGGLATLFAQLLESRNGMHYEVENIRAYDGGIGGEIDGEPVLVGGLSFLHSMGVEIPQGVRISQAVCAAIDGELCGLFAMTYEKDRSSAAGFATLCAYRKLRPVIVTHDFMLNEQFLRSRFGVRTRRILFPEHAERTALAETEQEDIAALMMTTRDGLASLAFGVTGARVLKKSCTLGTLIHMIGGILGVGIMLALTILGATELLTPGNLFLYELVWMIPGLIVTEWTRSI